VKPLHEDRADFDRMTLLDRLLRRNRTDHAAKILHYHHLLLLTSTAFEHEVAALLRERGFRKTVVSGGRGDLAADIVGRDEQGRSLIVRCKQYSPRHSVGSREIQLFIGMSTTHHRAERRMYVTTSKFTRDAAELARKHKIELIDGDRLARMLTETRGQPEPGPEPPFPELLRYGLKGHVVDAFKALAVQQVYAEEQRELARLAGCQCVRADAEWNVSGDHWHLYKAVVAWCPVCGRPATEAESSKMRLNVAQKVEEPPPGRKR